MNPEPWMIDQLTLLQGMNSANKASWELQAKTFVVVLSYLGEKRGKAAVEQAMLTES
jgi:hypothetical protein